MLKFLTGKGPSQMMFRSSEQLSQYRAHRPGEALSLHSPSLHWLPSQLLSYGCYIFPLRESRAALRRHLRLPLPTRLQLLSLPALLPLTSGSTGLRLEMHGYSCALGFLLVHPQLASESLTQTRKVLSSDKCFRSGFYLLHEVPLARREEASCCIFFLLP